jgi:hypothetical protein
MRALIDADLLLYECSAVAEYPKDEPVKSFDHVIDVFKGKIREILDRTGADSYSLYVTGDNNFRFDVAKTKPYKGNRKQEKPYHYKNIKACVLAMPECVLTEGCEADDQICIDQTEDTIICTRDKDLRMVGGNHFGWESGMQGQFGPKHIDKHGYLDLSSNRKKISGGGMMFFYSQLLTGDSTDNIPGLKGYGDAKAYDALKDCKTEQEMFEAVQWEYEAVMKECWQEYMLEQGQLLWMVRERDEAGELVHWTIPTFEDEENGE